MNTRSLRTLVLVWAAWFIILYAFQWLITSRLDIGRPDLAVPWTETETEALSNHGKIYLLEPFLNRQVAWDSEYYVGIAVVVMPILRQAQRSRQTDNRTSRTIPSSRSTPMR